MKSTLKIQIVPIVIGTIAYPAKSGMAIENQLYTHER